MGALVFLVVFFALMMIVHIGAAVAYKIVTRSKKSIFKIIDEL